MKKTVLLLMIGLAYNLSAQVTTGISSYQNLDSDYYDAIHEVEITTKGNINFSLSIEELDRRYNLGLGYSMRNKNVNVTPSIIVGSNIGLNKKMFYGFDTDLDINLLKWFSISAKCRYTENADGDFRPTYFAGFKLIIN